MVKIGQLYQQRTGQFPTPSDQGISGIGDSCRDGWRRPAIEIARQPPIGAADFKEDQEGGDRDIAGGSLKALAARIYSGRQAWPFPRASKSLEQDSNRLNQKEDSHIWGFVIQDAGWGWGPASDGKTLFAGPAGSCDWFGCERPHVPGDGGAVWGERGQRCEVVVALAGERQRGGQADGRLETTAAEERTGVVAGADRREAG